MSDAPLADIVVLDLCRVLSGPFATQQLIDLGAEVIKIERPDRGDDTRGFGPPFLEGESSYFLSVNRGKKSVAIDLSQPEGRDLVRRLALQSDVLIENFRPGVVSSMGLSLDELRAEHPSLVTCSISGYGEEGRPEYTQRGGYDVIIQAVSGLMEVTGPIDGPPCRVGVAIADLVAGLYAAQGILAALLRRARRGEGSHVEVSMQDAACAIMTYQAGIYLNTGRSPTRMGDAHPSISPYQSVECKDGLLVIAVGSDAQFGRLVRALGRPELAEDPRFHRNRDRVVHRQALLAELEPELRARSVAECEAEFLAAGIPAGPVLSVSEALEHPQLQARSTILSHEHPSLGTIRTVGSPIRFQHEPLPPCPAPPTLGQHTEKVLNERLGLDLDSIADLQRRGVVSGRERRPI